MVYYKYYYSYTGKIAVILSHGKFRMVPDL